MRILISILFAAAALTAASAAFAQNIPASAEKVNVKGKIMYAHTVKKGETLFSLGKAYGIEIAEIQKQNPQIAAGLKTGMILYIPVADTRKNKSRKEENDRVRENTGKKTTVPSRRETVAEEQSGRREAMRSSTARIVPERSGAEKPDTKKYKRHTVRWYETLEDIALFYNVPAETIVALNKLPQGSVKKRQVLSIPDQEYVTDYLKSREEKIENGFITHSGTDTAALSPELRNNGVPPEYNGTDNRPDRRLFPGDSPAQPPGFAPLEENYYQREPFRVGLILPLGSVYPEEVNSNFMDFYAGALLAVKDMKARGMNMEINVYDQSAYPSVKKLAENESLEDNQLLIGPVRTYDLEQLSGFSLREQIPLISPMDQTAESLTLSNPFLVQAPVSNNRQIENILEQIKKDLYRTGIQKILLVYEKDGEDTALVRITENLLKESFIQYSVVSYGILEGRGIYGTLLEQLNQSGPDTLNSAVFVPSNSEAFVSDVVRNLGLTLSNGTRKIHLYGLPKWRNFETIDPELFHRMNLQLSLPYFVDYSSTPVKEFLLQYRALYQTEPSPYAFQGYDIVRYFLSNLKKYGKSLFFQQKMPEGKLLQADFNFYRKTPDTGFENLSTRNIRYNPDYSVTFTGE